jgi:hypothetical protein
LSHELLLFIVIQHSDERYVHPKKKVKEKTMKKLCFLAAAILFSSMAFAQGPAGPAWEQGIEKFSIEVNVGMPFHWTNGIHDDQATAGNRIEDKSVTANTAIGFAMNYNFNGMIGLTLDMDFSLGAKLDGFASPTSDYLSLAGANAFLGPVIYLYNSNSLRIPFAFGVHMYYFADDLWIPDLGSSGAWVNRQEFQLGPQVSLGIQYHFSRGIYMFGRTSASVDILRVHSMTGSDGSAVSENTHTDSSLNWSVKPCIGIGIKF